MAINDKQWQLYLHQLALSLEQAVENCAPDMLTIASINLSQQRLAIPQSLPVTQILSSEHNLPAPAIQAELLLGWSKIYKWPFSTIQKLLTACYFSLLSAASSPDTNLQRWQRYPALLAAHRLRTLSDVDTQELYNVLIHCYPHQRQQPSWQRRVPCMVLTLAEQIATLYQAGKADGLQVLGSIIMQTDSEQTLTLIRRLIQATPITHTLRSIPVEIEAVLENSHYRQLTQAEKPALLCQLNEYHLLSSVLLNYASKINRQKKVIADLRHAINLVGEQTLNMVLAQADLQQLCEQQSMPLHSFLRQFTQCLAEALLLCGPTVGNRPQSELLAWCMCTPMWLNDRLHLIPLIYVKSGLTSLSISSSFLLGSPAYVSQVCVLLEHYQLDKWRKASVEWYAAVRKGIDTTELQANKMILAWRLACNLYLAEADAGINPLISKLALSQHFTDLNLQIQLLESSQCYYPLSADL